MKPKSKVKLPSVDTRMVLLLFCGIKTGNAILCTVSIMMPLSFLLTTFIAAKYRTGVLTLHLSALAIRCLPPLLVWAGCKLIENQLFKGSLAHFGNEDSCEAHRLLQEKLPFRSLIIPVFVGIAYVVTIIGYYTYTQSRDWECNVKMSQIVRLVTLVSFVMIVICQVLAYLLKIYVKKTAIYNSEEPRL